MTNKKFDKQLFDENDPRARAKAKQLLSKRFIVEDGSKYDIDLVCYKDNQIKYLIEVEVKNAWKGLEFPWPEINVQYAKKKFFEPNENSKLMMFNDDLTSCFIIDRETILNSPVELNWNRLAGKKLPYYKVPYEKVIHHKNI